MRLKTDNKNIFLISFLIIVCAVLPIMIANGGNFFLVGDYMTQQIPFIKECKRMLLSGKPFWSCNTFFGTNFLGTYSFYNYASPFYWPLFLVPENYLGIALGITFALKHAVAALTSFVYLKKHIKTPHFAFVGAMLYAFSSFSMDSSFYYHFIDVIAVFPLVLYLTDEVLDNRKKVLFSLTVLLNSMINYYFLFGTSVFFVIYLFFRVKFSDKKYNFKDAVRCIVYYALGGFASFFILLPTAFSLLETSKATGSFSGSLLRGLSTIPQIIKLLKGIFLPSEGIMGSSTGFTYSVFNSNAAFIPFFGGVFLLVILRKKSDAWYNKLIKFLFVLTLVPFGNGIFSFFTNMNYTRWWYAFVLTEIFVSLKYIEDNPEKIKKECKKSAATITGISAVVIFAPLIVKIFSAYVLKDFIYSVAPSGVINYLENTSLTQKFTVSDLRYAITFIILVLISFVPLYLFIKKDLIFKAEKLIPTVALVCLLSYGVYLANETNIFDSTYEDNYIGSIISENQEISYNSRTQYEGSVANYPMVVNEPGVTVFHSFKSKSTAEFCRLVGFADTLHASSRKYFDTPAIQSVLSIEKIVDKDGKKRTAEYYTPFGFSYDYYVIDDFEYTADKKENNRRIELMTAACIVDTETAEKLDGIAKKLDDNDFNLKNSIDKNRQTAAVEFEMNSSGFAAKTTGEKQRLIYFSIPHDNGWTAYVNGEETEILTVNGGMMGIIVPEGESDVLFEFATPGLTSGIVISIASLVFLTVLVIIDRKKKDAI